MANKNFTLKQIDDMINIVFVQAENTIEFEQKTMSTSSKSSVRRLFGQVPEFQFSSTNQKQFILPDFQTPEDSFAAIFFSISNNITISFPFPIHTRFTFLDFFLETQEIFEGDLQQVDEKAHAMQGSILFS